MERPMSMGAAFAKSWTMGELEGALGRGRGKK